MSIVFVELIKLFESDTGSILTPKFIAASSSRLGTLGSIQPLPSTQEVGKDRYWQL